MRTLPPTNASMDDPAPHHDAHCAELVKKPKTVAGVARMRTVRLSECGNELAREDMRSAAP